MLCQAIGLVKEDDNFMNLVVWYRLIRIQTQLLNLSNCKLLPWNDENNVDVNEQLKIEEATLTHSTQSLTSPPSVYLSASCLNYQNLTVQDQYRLSWLLRVPVHSTESQGGHL